MWSYNADSRVRLYAVDVDVLITAGACPGGGSEGSRPIPAPAQVAFIHTNNIDVVITIIYIQKYVLFEIMYT